MRGYPENRDMEEMGKPEPKSPFRWAIAGATIGTLGAGISQLLHGAGLNSSLPIAFQTGLLGGIFWGAIAALIVNRLSRPL